MLPEPPTTLDSLARLNAALAGRYAVERELGRGGMATVYLARDLRHDRQVALKALSPELARALGAERFLLEIRIAARLAHPHILPLHDSGEADGILFYVMPFVEGESLRDRLAREKQLGVDEALRITREVADALHYAYAHGVLHRDIKPENILLEAGHAVVADFGIARAVGEAGGQHLTSTGLVVGTPTYMSPEQAAGGAQLDGRSDLYSLACVLYEMLAGQPPFSGPTVESIVRQHLVADPPSVTLIRPSVPGHVAAALGRALSKTPADRFKDTGQFAAALERKEAVGETRRRGDEATRRRGDKAPRRRIAVSVALIALVVILAAFTRRARVLWVRSFVLPSIHQQVADGDWEAAYRQAARIDGLLAGDPAIAALWASFADTVTIEGTPAGARVYRRPYDPGLGGWRLVGSAPLARVLVPRLPLVSQFKFEAAGFATGFDIEAAAPAAGGLRPVLRFSLAPAGKVPQGMVLVLGGDVPAGLPQLGPDERARIGDYYLDRLEVTNREYQAFVDSGGYRRRDLWTETFVVEDRQLSWEEAMARFVDQTGRPGPSTWEAGRYPTDRADHPVGGVSWYEAMAYARFRGKRLPNVFEWSHAARFRATGAIVPASNIDRVRSGTVPVGTFRGMSASGALDLAGNVREWCVNESKSAGGRYILGGGWNDPAYKFYESAIHPPFDRTASNGIRLVGPAGTGQDDGSGTRAIEPLFRDYRVERPVPDRAFQFYRRLFAYDPLPVAARLERRDSTAQWVREKVSYAAAYGGERVTAHIFLPLNARPPYQTVVFFPGSPALRARSSDSLMQLGMVDYLVHGGRTVVYPVYQGTYERDDGTRISDPDPSSRYREHVIQWQQDVSRTLDYLVTRPDVDSAGLAYLGFSWGGRMGGVVLAIEPRFRAAVLVVAGLNFRPAQSEVDDLNYMPRVRVPVLMLNGRYDNTFPLETAARPMFDLLGTPPEHKKFVVVDGVHYVPRHALIRETLKWLDRYLGPVE